MHDKLPFFKKQFLLLLLIFYSEVFAKENKIPLSPSQEDILAPYPIPDYLKNINITPLETKIPILKSQIQNTIENQNEVLDSDQNPTIPKTTNQANKEFTQKTFNSTKKENKKIFAFIYRLDFDFLLDNTEESQNYWPTRTLFAGKITPQIGISFKNQKLLLGGYFIQNMGEKYPSQGKVNISYDFKYNAFKGYFGIFPKKEWIGEYPFLFFRKDFLFFNPMINGILLQYTPKRYDLAAELIFDWYGGNLTKRIDEFLVQGYLHKNFFNKAFYLGGAFLLYHFKNDEILNLDHHHKDTYLLDRIYYQAFVGSDLSSLYPIIDKLNFKLSLLGSLERKRRLSTGSDPFSNLYGAQFELQAQYKGFGLENHIYYGKKQFKYFHQYGENFYTGLPFYQSTFYDRLEAYYEYKNHYITSRISFILHFTKDTIAYQQMLTLGLDTQKLFSMLLGR